jgi:hypothetical protein
MGLAYSKAQMPARAVSIDILSTVFPSLLHGAYAVS